MKNSSILYVFFVLVVFSCRKDKVTKTIHGIVMNKAIREPVKDLTVCLGVIKDTRGGLILLGPTMWGKYDQQNLFATTDNNGRFVFSNVKYGSKGALFDYRIFTVSRKSIHNGRTEFSDADKYIPRDNLEDEQLLEVCPLIDYMHIQLNPATPMGANDSVSVVLRHKYNNSKLAGSLPYTHTVISQYIKTGNRTSGLQGEVMGRWYLEITKLKNGINSVTQDSVFLNYGDSLTYQLNF